MASQRDRIQPYEKNPFYWQLGGEPVVLLGGSVEDNLFQIDRLEAHLDTLAACGGNYVRCTMSSRDEGDVWPFERNDDGLYDLEKPGVAYWEKFRTFCELTAERGIVAQLELWDRFDYARDPWQDNPLNPKNNVNYTSEESGLAVEYAQHPSKRENGFFRSVPALENNELLLKYQHAHIDKLLSIALDYGHLLYCMDNETNESPEWGAYWSTYIRRRAGEAGAEIHTTEMWDAHDISSRMHQATWKHPETYSFCDISQNNHSNAVDHWQNMQWFRQQIAESGEIRPINTVKIYGANSGCYGSTRDAQERFWRNIFGGLAATRFHRPAAGLGLNEIAQANIRSMRMVLSEIDIFSCRPAMDLVRHRSWNEAYATARPGSQYAVFFPDGGDVLLDVTEAEAGAFDVRWLAVRDSAWTGDPVRGTPETRGDKRYLRLTSPTEEGYWAAVVKAVTE